MDKDIIFKGHVTIRAVSDRQGRLPVKRWLDALSARDRRRAEAGMVNFDRLEAAGIRNAGRVELIRGRRRSMLELKLTRGGTPGPQLRLLGVMRGKTFWAAHGFLKTTRRITRRDLDAAEAVLDVWGGPSDAGNDSGTGPRP
jgi:hypothetical protein